ncbi:hypothetical protein G7Y79_00007g021230 [Physcia stellaris]|nr:hypothetical protein G7Y79_00007g021230 [Physcia stellaris]
MISATRRWLRRNRTNFAIGAGVLGIGYVAGQYVLSKITEARERMTADRIAKENLRRRFQQNQEDCTFTVLALLPTATENILEALPVENITRDLQQKKAERLGRSEGGTSDPSVTSAPTSTTEDDGRSLSSFQSESYVHASQTESSNSDGKLAPRKSKAQLWNELKISSITRSFTLLYTLSLLTLLTRIQLNLLGRRNYLSSVVSLASHPSQDPTISLENRDDDNVDQAYGNDFETNRKFLTFSWWLLHRGWRDLMYKIEEAVQEVFGPLNPREDIPLDRLSALILDVRRKVEGSTPEERRSTRWLQYLLPPLDQEDTVLRESGMSASPSPPSGPAAPTPSTAATSPPPTQQPSPTSSTSLRRLLDETADLIESPPFTRILTLLLDTTFSHLVDQKLRTQAFKVPPLPSSPAPEARIQEVPSPSIEAEDPSTAKAKLATILAVMTKQAHYIGAGMPNEYVQAMEGVREVEAFAAVVYSSAFELENPPDSSAAMDTKVEQEHEKEGGDMAITETGVEDGIADVQAELEDRGWRGGQSLERVRERVGEGHWQRGARAFDRMNLPSSCFR